MRDLYGVAGNALRFKVGWLGPLGRPSSVPPSLAGPHLSHPGTSTPSHGILPPAPTPLLGKRCLPCPLTPISRPACRPYITLLRPY